jgi:hypothetical protein
LTELETANAEAIASASETPSPAPSTPSETTPSPEATEAAIDADLQAIWAKNNPARDESGKFKSANPEAPAAETQGAATGETKSEGHTSEDKPVETVNPSIDPPSSWSREVREKWAALPPDLQEYIAKRESEAHSQITRLGTTARAAEPLLNVIEQNRELFARRNVQPEQGVAALLNAQRKLDENPVAAIGWLAQQYGVDLSMFANADGSQSAQSPQVAMLQAEIASMRAQLAETSSTVRQTQVERQAAELAKHQSAVDAFLNGKNLTESDESELVVLIASERQFNPGKNAEQLLQDAWETFQARSPERRQKMIEQQILEAQAKKDEEAKKKATEAKKLASINVRSTPASSPNGKTMDDTLQEIARRAYGR